MFGDSYRSRDTVQDRNESDGGHPVTPYRLTLVFALCAQRTQLMTIDSVRSAAAGQTPTQPLCGRNSRAEHPGKRTFLRHHMARLLCRIGSTLPQWLNGPELAHAARDIERMCWRELGHGKAPLFPGDVPPFLLHDENGHPTGEPLQEPMPPAELAARLAVLELSMSPSLSPAESNLQVLARYLT